jgi:membrane associated rhomboid family serine protease
LFSLSNSSDPAKADRLLMTFRLASAWLLSLLTTIFLHEKLSQEVMNTLQHRHVTCQETLPTDKTQTKD